MVDFNSALRNWGQRMIDIRRNPQPFMQQHKGNPLSALMGIFMPGLMNQQQQPQAPPPMVPQLKAPVNFGNMRQMRPITPPTGMRALTPYQPPPQPTPMQQPIQAPQPPIQPMQPIQSPSQPIQPPQSPMQPQRGGDLRSRLNSSIMNFLRR